MIPVFPLPGALLLPRGQMPLNIFEPRYLAMIDDALKRDRIIGMIQPDAEDGGSADARRGSTRSAAPGRITQFAETGDGRYLITLTGIAASGSRANSPTTTPYRQCRVDLTTPSRRISRARAGEDEVDRAGVAQGPARLRGGRTMLQVDWQGIEEAPNEALVNALCMMSPFGVREKQALLEAADLKTRAEVLIALTEIELVRGCSGSDTTLQ